jgi:META domain-containing protein
MSMTSNISMASRSIKYVLAAMLPSMPLAGAHAMDISELKGRWVLETVDGKSVAPEKGEIYFQVTEQTITGYDGCNRFGGSVTQPSQAQRGQRGCPPDTKPLPLDFSNLLPQLSRATVSGDKLSVPLPDGKGEARFRRSQ